MLPRSVFRCSTLALLLFSSLAAPFSFGVTREFAQTYPLRPDGSFVLNNVNGTVRIEGWDKDVVEVRAVKTAPDKESNLDLVSIDVVPRPQALSLSSRYPQDEGV